MIDSILKYFPSLTDLQKSRLSQLEGLYREWNEKINVISRKDIDNLYVNHVLHSLSIGKFLSPVDGTSFIDVGTGGGFPGIPMAIVYPECSFHLIDRIKKKISVVNAVSEALGLENVTTQAGDLGECHERFDFVVSRAAMKMPELLKAARKIVSNDIPRNAYPNGIIALKGGDLREELRSLRDDYIEEPLTLWFDEPYFEHKELIYVPV